MTLLALACAPPAPPRPPDVLLVTLDTVRADALGAYGGPATPTLDRLAAEGTRFTRAFTTAPLTVPAHASIHTGLWPPRHGVRDNGDYFLGADAQTLAEVLKQRGYATMAAVGAEVTSRHWGFGQGFDAYYDDLGAEATGLRRLRAERRGDAVVRDALSWLQARKPDEPFFAWVHLYDAHDPYEAPEPYASKAARPYDGEVAWVDAQLGALLAGLGERERDTWIVVVADHGEALGEHGETTHGVLLHEGTTRVPFLVRKPGGEPGVVDAPVSLVDVMPTILAATGTPTPPVDGRDLGAALDPSRAVYAETLYAWRHYGWAPQYAWMTTTHTLIDSTTPELWSGGARVDDAALLSRMRAELAAFRAALSPAVTNTPASTSSDTVAMLEALGYATSTAPPVPPEGLPDPVTRLPALAGDARARAALRKGDLDTARREAEAALAAEPGLVETRQLLAQVHWRLGQRDAAWAVVAALDDEQPTARTRHLMGLLKLASGDLPEGVRLLEDSVARDPYLAPASETLLQTLLVLEDLPRLSKSAEAAHTHLPGSAIVTGMTGVSRALSGDAAGALPLLRAAIEAEPQQPFVHHGLGLALARTGDVEGAKAAFREEIRRYPPARASRAELERLGR